MQTRWFTRHSGLTPSRLSLLAMAMDGYPMRLVMAIFITFSLAPRAPVAAEDKRPPLKLVFPSKAGDVTFDHAAHSKRQKGDCAQCHDKLWPQSAKVAVTSSDGCKTCHHAKGQSFDMKGNCVKCHAAKGAPARRGS